MVNIVQQASGEAVATSLTVTLSDPVTAGNTICASVAVQDGVTAGYTVALTLGSSPDNWFLHRQAHRSASGSNIYTAEWADADCAGGADTVTVTLTGATGGFETSIMMQAYEVAGLPGATEDITGATSGNSATWTTGTFTPSASTATEPEFIWASVTYPSGQSITLPPGWTSTSPVTTSAGQAMVSGYMITTGIVSPLYDGTLGTDVQWACAGAALKSGTITGTAAISGRGTLAAHGGIAGTAPEAGTGTLSATASAGAPDTAFPLGQGTLAAAATVDIAATAAVSGAGGLAASGAPPLPVTVVNQWAATIAQNPQFGPSLPAAPSVNVLLEPSYSVGGGSGVPAQGNWLFAIAGWRQDPGATGTTVNVGSDDHQWWRPASPSPATGATRTTIWYQPNIGAITIVPRKVYVAPSGYIASMAVLVIEVAALGDWDLSQGVVTAYDPATTSLTLTLTI